MTTGLEIRPYEPGDRAAALRLVARSLGEGAVPRTESFWRWKHERSPFGPSPGLVACAAGELVGLRLFMRWQLRAGSTPVPSVRAVDTATHPEWRGRGIFSGLTRELVTRVAEEGVQLVFNTPNRFSRPGYLKMGWRDVARVPVLVRVLRPLRVLRGAMGRGSGSGSEAGVSPGRPVAELVETDGLEDLLVASMTGEERLHTPPTAAFLAWRYAAESGIGYSADWEVEGRSGAAVVVRRRVRRGRDELAVVTLVVSSDAVGVARGVRVLRRLAARSGADYVVASAAAGAAERSVLRGAGLLPFALPGPRFTVRPLRPDVHPDPGVWSSWRLGLGDLELF